MNKNFVISAMVSVLLLAFTAVAQNKAVDFSGNWELDATKSRIDQRGRVESMTMIVAQTAKEVKVTTQIKRAVAPEGTVAGGGPSRGLGRGFGGDTVMTYSLDGKETSIQQDSPMGPIPVKLNGKLDAGKLLLASARTFNGPNGEISLTSKETWSLSPDGKTLTISREQTSPRGPATSELVFVKK